MPIGNDLSRSGYQTTEEFTAARVKQLLDPKCIVWRSAKKDAYVSVLHFAIAIIYSLEYTFRGFTLTLERTSSARPSSKPWGDTSRSRATLDSTTGFPSQSLLSSVPRLVPFLKRTYSVI